MLLFRLHALRRYNPRPGLKVELIPFSAPDLARPCRRENGQLKRAGAHADSFAKANHEIWNNINWQRGVMFDLGNVTRLVEYRVKIALPSRRIEALPIFVRRGVVQHFFDPAAHSARRLGLDSPDRRQHAQHVRHFNFIHGHAAQDRAGVGLKRGGPLRTMFVVFPTEAFRLQHRSCTLVEGFRTFSICNRFSPNSLPTLDGV